MFRLKKKNLTEVADLDSAEILSLFESADDLRARRVRGERQVPYLKGRALGLVMAKPSTRTRISFELAMIELGGHALVLSSEGMQVSRGETAADTGRVFSRYLDGVAIRTFSQLELVELAENSSIPVINALTDSHHPCQALADFYTIRGKKGGCSGVELAYFGDGNNVCHSLMQAAVLLGARLRVFVPPGREPALSVIKKCRGSGEVIIGNENSPDLTRTDFIYTDVWVSMGQQEDLDATRDLFKPYQVNRRLLRRAGPGTMVMHCLPAHRGEEITSEIIDGNRSIVWEQAENRLHVQKALLASLL